MAKQGHQESTSALRAFGQEGNHRHALAARGGYGVKREYFQRRGIKAC